MSRVETDQDVMERTGAPSCIVVFLTLLTFLTACDSGSSGKVEGGAVQVGKQSVQVQFLTTNQERLKGVKRFPLFGDGEGALFVYPEAMPDLYWSNRNVLDQDLSVAFIGPDRSILRIDRMKPDTGRVVNAGAEAQFMLMVKGGWFARNEISAGDRLTVSNDVVAAAAPVQSIQTTRTINVPGHQVRVEVANTSALRRTGLMNRKAMPEDQGMLFVYSKPGVRSFHMKNTFIPLDIAFLKADGTIAEIKQMSSLDRTSTRSSGEVMHVLELRKGWFRDHDVKPGDPFDLTPLEEFMKTPEPQPK